MASKADVLKASSTVLFPRTWREGGLSPSFRGIRTYDEAFGTSARERLRQQRRDPCTGPPNDRKSVSNVLST